MVSTTEGILNMDNAHPPTDDEEPLLLDTVYVEEEQTPQPNWLVRGVIGALAMIVVFALFSQ